MKLKQAASKPKPVDAEEKSLKKMLAEERSRAKNIEQNVDKLDNLIKKHGTWDFFGPESAKKDNLIYQIAIDYAKLVDPESVAREGEVASAQKYMLPISKMMRQGTAEKIISSFREDLKNRRQNRSDILSNLYGEKYDKYKEKEEEPEYKEYKGKSYEVKYDENGRPYIEAE